MYILASDYDGTLSMNGSVSEETKEAIRRFRQEGNCFGVVTGRDAGIYSMLKDQGVEFDYVIPFNGAMALSQEGETLFEERGSGRVIRPIAEYMAQEFGVPLSSVTNLTRHTFHGGEPNGSERYEPLSVADEIREFTHLNTWCPSDADAARAVAEINRRYSDIVNALQNGGCIDIPPRGVDKGVGVARYAALAGVPEDNVYAAGDNINDMAMITRFHGCAMPNARDAVKAAAELTYEGRIVEIIEYILSLK